MCAFLLGETQGAARLVRHLWAKHRGQKGFLPLFSGGRWVFCSCCFFLEGWAFQKEAAEAGAEGRKNEEKKEEKEEKEVEKEKEEEEEKEE